MPVEDIFIPKSKKITDVNKQTIDEVQKEAQHMEVIDKTMGTARKLAGTDAMQVEMARKETRMAEIEKENKELQKQVQESRIEIVQKELGGKIDHLSETMKAGATPKSIGEQITDIKKTAGELGIGESRISELKNMADLIGSLRQTKGLAEQVKEAKDLLETLKPEKEAELSGVPASIMLEMKKMDHDVQLRIQQMEDERLQRKQEFDLKIKQWDEDRELRRDEVAAKIQIEKERNELMAGGLERLGRVFAQATSENPSQGVGAATRGTPPPIIEAGEGDFGEISCQVPGCHSSVPVARDAVSAICPGCGQRYTIKRIPVQETASED
jgi:predicted XRE-type DNA-binding protein